MDDCIFCKIVNKEVPAAIVYEDDTTLAFLDIQPVNKGHVLVIPKSHTRNLLTADPDTFAHMARTAHKIAHAVTDATNADGLNLTMNVEAAGGQEVFHAHMHVFPRFTGDSALQPAQKLAYDKGEAESTASDISAKLS